MPTELIVGFNGGEVSRNIESRVDLPLYKKSCSVLENFDVLPEGGARNRSGTKFIAKTKGDIVGGDAPAHLLDFSYSDDASYIFEFGNLYVRIYRAQTLAFVIDLVTPWTAAEAKQIQFERSYDVMWCVHPDHPEQTITRTALDAFEIEESIYDFPPLLDQNFTDTTIAPSGVSGTVSLVASAPLFFSGHVGSYWLIQQNRINPLESPAGFERGLTVGLSAVSSSQSTKWLLASYSEYRLETDGIWKGQVLLEFSNDNGVTVNNTIVVGDSRNSQEQNFIYDSIERAPADTWIRVRLVWQSGTSFSCNLRILDIQTYGLVQITAVADDQNATAEVISEMYDTSATKTWSEGAFSDVRGYPRSITLFEERRWLSGTYTEPNMVWGSQTGDYYNYFVGTLDDESIRRAPPVNGFTQWLDSKESLFLCTTDELITITGLTSNQGLTPTNFKFNIQSGFGSDYIQNELTNDVFLYVEKGGTKLRELIYSRDELNFQSNDISALAKHISKRGIDTTALVKLPEQRLVCVLDDGELGVLTYERTEQVVAWQRYTTDGIFVSVAATKNGDKDSVWYVIQRDGEYFIELVTDRDSELYWFVDSGVSFDGGDPVTNVTISVLDDPTGLNVNKLNVNSVGHGLSGGENIAFENSDLDYLNEKVFTVSVVDADNFVLRDEEDTVFVDAGYLDEIFLASVDVVGAGDPAVNQTYNWSNSGRTLYYNRTLVSDDSIYVLDNNGTTPWSLKATPFAYDGYNHPSSASFPPKTGWTVGVDGVAPAPTIDYTLPTYTGDYQIVTNTLTGLDHLEGKSVAVVGDNKYVGLLVVTGGEIKIEIASGSVEVDCCFFNKVVAGLPYVSTLSPLPIELVVTGLTVGSVKTIGDVVVKLKDSVGGIFGTDLQKMEPFKLRELTDPIGIQIDPINDDIRGYALDSYQLIKRLFVQQDLPLPFEILSISMNVRPKGR